MCVVLETFFYLHTRPKLPEIYLKQGSDHFDPYNVFLAIATLKTGFVVQGHIYFLPYSVIKMEKVFAVFTDCTLITLKLSLVKYLSKIRRQIIG